jgi:hypothetical protein
VHGCVISLHLFATKFSFTVAEIVAGFATDLFFQHLTMCTSGVKHFILLFVLSKRYKRCRLTCRFTITSNSDVCLDSSNAFSLLLSSTRLLIYRYFLYTMPIPVSNAMSEWV